MQSKKSTRLAPIDTLVIVGNGFDIWQGLDTSYARFKDYYFSNRDQILQKLGFTKHWRLEQEDGTQALFSDVEMIYGDPFDPRELGDGFWHTFETSLGYLDAERINFFFGKEDDDLDNLDITIENANAILREAFCSWISTISVSEAEPSHLFGDNCFFLNFNYTDTLQKRFHIPPERIFHIHGQAHQPDEIVFGHAKHPQTPLEELYQFGGRLRGLFLVEELLYETDKHAYLHYLEFLIYLARHGLRLGDIRHIYVLGHSFGPADREYFQELAFATGTKRKRQSIQDFSDLDPLDALHRMMGYVILTYGNDGPHPEFDPKEVADYGQYVCQLQKSQAWHSIRRQYRRRLSDRIKYPHRLRELDQVFSALPGSPPAHWHISYFSPEDKARIEDTVRATGIRDYTLHSTIEDCIASFQKELQPSLSST